MSRFESEMSSSRENLTALLSLSGAWIDSVQRDRSGFGAIVDAGEVVLALPGNSELIAVKPSGKEFTQLASIKVAETPTFAHPVIAGKRIFIKDKDTLTMYSL